MKMITVTLVDRDGNAVLLGPQARHALDCQRSPCEFTECNCAPKERNVRVHSPEEPRMQKPKK